MNSFVEYFFVSIDLSIQVVFMIYLNKIEMILNRAQMDR